MARQPRKPLPARSDTHIVRGTHRAELLRLLATYAIKKIRRTITQRQFEAEVILCSQGYLSHIKSPSGQIPSATFVISLLWFAEHPEMIPIFAKVWRTNRYRIPTAKLKYRRALRRYRRSLKNCTDSVTT